MGTYKEKNDFTRKKKNNVQKFTLKIHIVIIKIKKLLVYYLYYPIKNKLNKNT